MEGRKFNKMIVYVLLYYICVNSVQILAIPCMVAPPPPPMQQIVSCTNAIDPCATPPPPPPPAISCGYVMAPTAPPLPPPMPMPMPLPPIPAPPPVVAMPIVQYVVPAVEQVQVTGNKQRFHSSLY